MEESEVYNITVSGNRNYFAGGVLVHNSLSPALQKMVNQVSDHRQGVEISEAGGYVALEDGAKLMVGGTMNPSGTFGGTFDLNRDLRSRFNELARDFPSDRKLKEVLKVNGVPKKIGNYDGVRDQIVSFVQNVHSQVESNKVSYEFSPRDAVRLGKTWRQSYEDFLDLDDDALNEAREGLRMALEICVLGKFRDEQERSTVEEDINDCFVVDSY